MAFCSICSRVRLAAALLLLGVCLGCMDNPAKRAYPPGPPLPMPDAQGLLWQLQEGGKYIVRIAHRIPQERVITVVRYDADDIMGAMGLLYLPPEFSREQELRFWHTGVDWVSMYSP